MKIRTSSLHRVDPGKFRQDPKCHLYSRLKFGDLEAIEEFSGNLIERIQDDIGAALRRLAVVTPGGSGVRNAAYLLGERIAARIGTPHFVLETLSKATDRAWYRSTRTPRLGGHSLCYFSPADQNCFESLAGRSVIVVDDAVYRGQTQKLVRSDLGERGLRLLGIYTVLDMSPGKDSAKIRNLEQEIDELVLQADRPAKLISLWNGTMTVPTTRSVYYVLALKPRDLDHLLENISDDALASLCLTSLVYAEPKFEANLRRIASACDRRFRVSWYGRSSIIGPLGGSSSANEIITTLLSARHFRLIASSLENWMLSPFNAHPHVAKLERPAVIFFDLDNTLCFADEYYSKVKDITERFFAEKTGMTSEAVRTVIDSMARRLRQTGRVLTHFDIALEFGVDFSLFEKELHSLLRYHQLIRRDHDVRCILEHLSGTLGFRLAVLTNGSQLQAEGVLRALGVFDLFEKVVAPVSGGPRKPAREFFDLGLKSMGVKAADAAMVGDSRKTDILPARKLGMRTVLIRERDQLLNLVSVLAGSDVDRQIENFVQDVKGFIKRYDGPTDSEKKAEMFREDFVTVLRTSWMDFPVDSAGILATYDRLFRLLRKMLWPVEKEIRDLREMRVANLSDVVNAAASVLDTWRLVKDCPNRVYIGLDGLWWYAWDRDSSHFFFDGARLCTRKEMELTRPFLRELLPEHRSISNKVMERLVQRSFEENPKSERELVDLVWKRFEQEMENAREQHSLIRDLEKLANTIDARGEGRYSAEERRNFLLSQAELAESENVFRQKAAETGADFVEAILRSSSEATFIDKGEVGCQLWFIKLACKWYLGGKADPVNIRVLVPDRTGDYGPGANTIYLRTSLPSLLERTRPIRKFPLCRTAPKFPCLALSEDRQELLEGLVLFVALVSRSAETASRELRKIAHE
jgi:putative hydrolase of the HAD superfamily